MRRAPEVDVGSVLTDLLTRSGVATRAGPAGTETRDDPTTATLLGAASTLLSERGSRGWTMEDVAERAGVGRATLYRRFPSRDGLVEAAIVRDARGFFAAVAESVRAVEPLDEKVVAGFVTGLDLARRSPLSALLARDPEAAVSLLTSPTLLQAATGALVERYEAIVGGGLPAADRFAAEAQAEALIRLAVTFVLVPGTGPDGDAARARIAAMIRPLMAARSAPRR